MIKDYLNIVIGLCAVAILCCAFLLGLKMGVAIGDAKVRKVEIAQLEASRQAALDSYNRLVKAQVLADELQRRLDVSDQARVSQALEHTREIKRLTRGEPCLNAGTVRLLNTSSGIQQPAVPETAGRPDVEDAAAATDTDVAEWADNAIRQYATCRDRLGALIDFEEAEDQEK